VPYIFIWNGYFIIFDASSRYAQGNQKSIIMEFMFYPSEAPYGFRRVGKVSIMQDLPAYSCRCWTRRTASKAGVPETEHGLIISLFVE
jgi:hypothetical protein